MNGTAKYYSIKYRRYTVNQLLFAATLFRDYSETLANLGKFSRLRIKVGLHYLDAELKATARSLKFLM
jgi:hypothetical protein